MKPLPDLQDQTAMAARGRRSVLMSARNEACEALRDACVRAQSADIGEDGEWLDKAMAAASRLREIAKLWNTA